MSEIGDPPSTVQAAILGALAKRFNKRKPGCDQVEVKRFGGFSESRLS